MLLILVLGEIHTQKLLGFHEDFKKLTDLLAAPGQVTHWVENLRLVPCEVLNCPKKISQFGQAINSL